MISKLKSISTPLFRVSFLPSLTIRSFPRQHITNFYNFSNQKNPESINKIKQQAKKFYTQQVERIIEIDKTQDWQKIIPNCQEPIVIDFYADWCQPCKILTPKLKERVLKSPNTRMVMINIDKCPQLAHALQIKSVPTVFLVYKNQAIDRFQGVVSDTSLDTFFQAANKIQALFNSYEQSIKKLDQGKKLMSQGKFAQASQIFTSMKNINDQELESFKQLLLTQCFLALNQVVKFKNQIQKLKSLQQFYLKKQQVKSYYQLMIKKYQELENQAKGNPQVLKAQQLLKKNPQSLQQKYNLAVVYKKNDMIQESLSLSLQIVEKNKQWQEKKANKFILEIFKQLGNSSPITQKYRKIYQRLLY